MRGTARRTAITCTGYSARGGDAAALRTLGLARATAVCDRIAAQTGARTTVSYGGALPVLVPGTSGQNRKVVVRIG